jgi:hypothetical protein
MAMLIVAGAALSACSMQASNSDPTFQDYLSIQDAMHDYHYGLDTRDDKLKASAFTQDGRVATVVEGKEIAEDIPASRIKAPMTVRAPPQGGGPPVIAAGGPPGGAGGSMPKGSCAHLTYQVISSSKAQPWQLLLLTNCFKPRVPGIRRSATLATMRISSRNSPMGNGCSSSAKSSLIEKIADADSP